MKPSFLNWLLSVFLVVVMRMVTKVPAALGIVQEKHPAPDLPIIHLLGCSLPNIYAFYCLAVNTRVDAGIPESTHVYQERPG